MTARMAHWTSPLIFTAMAAQAAATGTFSHQGTTDWPSSLGTPGTFTRQLVADFDGDGLKDVYVLAGGKPLLFHAPDTWEALYEAWDSQCVLYNDMAVIPDASEGAWSEIAVVGQNGLERITYNPDQSVPMNGELVNTWFSRFTIADDSYWERAKLVRTGDLDNDTTLDYVGLAADGQTFIVRRYVQGQPQQIEVTLEEEIFDIAILQWNPTSLEREIALLDSHGVEIFTHTGSRIRRFERPGTSGLDDAFCLFRKNMTVGDERVPDGKDRIAWFRRLTTASPYQELVELSSPSQTNQVLNTGITFEEGNRVISASAADACSSDGLPNGDWDLTVHTLDSFAPLHLRNLETEPGMQPENVSFSLEESETVEALGLEAFNPAGIQGTDTMAAPIFEDFSGDGFPDLFLAVQGDDEDGPRNFLQVWRGSPCLEYLPSPSGPAGFVTELKHYTRPASNTFLLPTGAKMRVDLTFAVPHQDTEYLEFLLWSRDPVDGSYASIDHIYYEFDYADMLPNPPVEIYPIAPFPLPADAGNDPCFDEQYWFEMRFSKMNAGGSLVSLSTNYIAIVGANQSPILELENPGYSSLLCFDDMASCNLPDHAHTCFQLPFPGQYEPTYGPLCMTRRRIAAPGGSGGAPLLPIPVEAQPAGPLPPSY